MVHFSLPLPGYPDVARTCACPHYALDLSVKLYMREIKPRARDGRMRTYCQQLAATEDVRGDSSLCTSLVSSSPNLM